MANNDLSNSENILIKTDENNLIYVDPNSVLVNNEVQPRSVSQERLVMYVNLEADIIPRTTLTSDGDKNSLRSIAKGTLNFLSSQVGDSTDPNDRNFTTNWTDAYLERTERKSKDGNTTGDFFQNDGTGQSFGIESISVQIKGANLIPQITIEFADVRGKTLFDSPENSPYKSFFHIPWPIFYLTIKGYYGKAIRYRLHLVSFSSRFNANSGNFEVTTKFVGSTYAYMSDIPLKAVLNAPYMFIRTIEGSQSFNEQTGLYEKKALKSSKGYQILQSVYSEMKQKKLIPQDLPVRTLREICTLASTLDKRLEQQIFDEVIDPKVLDGIRSYREVLKNFEIKVNGWKNKNLDLTLYSDQFTFNSEASRGYALKSKNKLDLTLVTGSTNNDTLEYIITTFSELLKKQQKVFNDNVKSGGAGVDTKLLSNSLLPIDSYYGILSSDPTKYYIFFERIISDIQTLQKVFFEQNIKVEKEIEKKMNEIIKDPQKGFGFEPTVRNLFGILMANAEVYVRLMKDVHSDAFDLAEERKIIIGKFSDEFGDSIYPWPEIKKTTPGDKQRVIAYPGEPELQSKLQSFNSTLWPEVSFVEEFMGVSTNVKDPLVEKEGGVNDLQYVFDSNQDESRIKDVSQLFKIQQTLPYSDRRPVSFLYEIYERALQMTMVDSFNPTVLRELADIEFGMIQEIVGEELDIIDILKNNIKSKDDLLDYMKKLSPYERYSYYEDSLPTTNYIKEAISTPFKIEQYDERLTGKTDTTIYEKLDNFLINYTPESYRKQIFPFSSNTYLDYIEKDSFTDDELKFEGLFRVGVVGNDFISSSFDRFNWIKPPYMDLSESFNMFTQSLFVGKNVTNILNTPYFHKQLYSDFSKTSSFGKYAGSAYLFLNSLPYHDLEDEIRLTKSGTQGGTTLLPPKRMSSIFREIGATHYVPYHLIVKWGSIYHRYKRKVLDGVDILTGFTTSNSNTTTTNINTDLFFNNNETGTTFTTFTFNSTNVNYLNNKDVGVHPFYDAIYHQVVNDYNHYVVSSGNTSFSGNTVSQKINGRVRPKENGLNYWTQYVDNSKFDSTDMSYTILPSDGGNKYINLKDEVGIEPSDFDFDKTEQLNFRLLWQDEYIDDSFSGETFFDYDEYNISLTEDIYKISSNQKKVFDLIGTFSPQILDEFEEIFLQFSSELINIEDPFKKFSNVKYDNFQKLLKEIVKIEKKSDDGTEIEDIILKIKTRQKQKLVVLSEQLTKADNYLKITLGNPKELDAYVLNNYIDQTESWGSYDFPSQSGNTKYIELYVGQNPDSGITYQDFFRISDIRLDEENVLLFRPLILIYAGYLKFNGTNTREQFSLYLKNNIIDKKTSTIVGGTLQRTNEVGGSNNRLNLFLIQLISKFPSLKLERNDFAVNFVDGYNNRQVKVELYNSFKSFNDKWVAGNSLGQRLLFEEFLFLDRANRDIGSKTYLNLTKFIDLIDSRNDNIDLYSTISTLLKGSGFDMRALPGYVNFYGTNISNRSKITPSKKVAENLFGTFLDVDYEESSPKIIIQFVGPTSKHPSDMGKDYKFNDDSFDISNRNKNPLIATLPELYDIDQLNKSNKVVAFEVSFGDQYQNIFKGVSLDQTTLKNTSESFVVLENLARSESGAGTYNVDVSLFDYYRQASYSCDVTCMGNVMIQPTMYFYLKNIPMFRGTYWITEVSHNIRDNNIETSFKGTRIPVAALPDPEDSFVSSYKSLLDKITNSARAVVKKIESANTTGTTEQTIRTDFGNFVTDMGTIQINGEQLIKTSGISQFGIPFNGYGNEKYIQKVTYKQQNGQEGEWFRAKVARMGLESTIYELSDSSHMSLLSKLQNTINVNSEGQTGLKWSELKELSNSHYYYSTKFQFSKSITADKIITGVTEFLNPNNNKEFTLNPNYDLDRRVDTLNVSGPVNVGPFIDGYGIGLSNKLMSELKIVEGQILYFRIK
jgi:hypothetical protein